MQYVTHWDFSCTSSQHPNLNSSVPPQTRRWCPQVCPRTGKHPARPARPPFAPPAAEPASTAHGRSGLWLRARLLLDIAATFLNDGFSKDTVFLWCNRMGKSTHQYSVWGLRCF